MYEAGGKLEVYLDILSATVLIRQLDVVGVWTCELSLF